MLQKKDRVVADLERAKKPVAIKPPKSPMDNDPPKPAPKKVYRQLNRSIAFPAKTLENEADIDAYVESIRSQLKQYLQGSDGIKLN